MSKYVKLPNGKIVTVDENGFVSVKVVVELSDFIDNNLEGLLDLLSEEATGTEILSNISYSVVGHNGNTLGILVTGDIQMIDVVDVDFESLPMTKFEVGITRIGYGSRTVRFSARTAEEARNIADDDAGSHVYSEYQSEYVFDVQNLEGN